MTKLDFASPAPITTDHELANFDSGDWSLNDWVKKRAYKGDAGSQSRGLRGHVPARPGCTTPQIRFLFIAPQFWIQLPSNPISR